MCPEGTKPVRRMCQSFGSLKTEEKTERQCGQSVRGSFGS